MASSLPTSSHYSSLPMAAYEQLLAEKVHYLQQCLVPFTSTQLLENMAVYASPKSHFRMRAEFGVWHEGDDCYYTMTQKDAEGNKQKVKITGFAIASEAINTLMPALLEKLKSHAVLKQKLFQIEFLNTLAGDMLVTLIYHKKLADDWLVLAQQLEKAFGIYIIGRSRRQKLVVSQDFVLEKLQVHGSTFTYKQLEGGFTQPNAQVCQHMLIWACEQAAGLTSDKQTDLLELYCGNANFTLPLSLHFRQVLATEISKTSVAAAQWNISKNNRQNIAIARLSAQEFTEANSGAREFKRLKQANISLADYDFSTVFVDPPRAGIDDATLALLAGFEHIIYISCNPDTLAANLHTLSNTHKVTSTALFDQFPYTEHIEAGVCLVKSL